MAGNLLTATDIPIYTTFVYLVFTISTDVRTNTSIFQDVLDVCMFTVIQFSGQRNLIIIIIIIFIFLQTGYNYIDDLMAIYRHRILYAVQKWRRSALMQSALLDAKKSLEAHKILSCGVTTYMKYFIRIRKLINNNT
jgi:hypothetical protein